MRHCPALLVAAPLAAATLLLTGCGSSPLLVTSAPVASTTSSASSTSTPSTSTTSSDSTSSSSSSSSSSSGLSASHDPCQLLTLADVQSVLGGSVTKVSSTSNVCAYVDSGSGIAVALSTADLPGGTAAANAAVKAAAGTAGGTVTNVDGLGDAGAASGSAGKSLVAFEKSGALVVVVVQATSSPDGPAKALALARLASAKL